MLRLEVFGFHEAQIGFLRQPLLFFRQLFQILDGVIHLGLPFELTELLQGPVELFFHRVVVELHLVELLLDLFRIHFLHELLHLFVDLTKFLAHDVVHEFLELILLVQDALFLLAEFVGPFVFALVFFAHVLQLFVQRLLLLEQILHGLTVLPRHFTLFAHAFLHGLHGFAEFRRLPRSLFEVFFNVVRRFFTLLADFIFARRSDPGGSGSGHFGSMHAVVVPNLKPTLQDVALAPIQIGHVPGVEKRALPTRRNLQFYASAGFDCRGLRGSELGGCAWFDARSTFGIRPNKAEPTEPIIVLHVSGEVLQFA